MSSPQRGKAGSISSPSGAKGGSALSSPTGKGGGAPSSPTGGKGALGSPSGVKSAQQTFQRVLPPQHARYQGHRTPEAKYDVTAGKDMPAWSTSICACSDNLKMVMCAMTGVGTCVIHGQVQDALYGNGCCLSCLIGLLTVGECGRQRSFFRKRLQMPGGEYLCSGALGDCFEVLGLFPLTACQEARELEIRSLRRWHPLRGFRGIGEEWVVGCCGEETTRNVLSAYKPKPKDVLREGMLPDDEGSSGGSDSDSEPPDSPIKRHFSKPDMMLPPTSVDYMTR